MEENESHLIAKGCQAAYKVPNSWSLDGERVLDASETTEDKKNDITERLLDSEDLDDRVQTGFTSK